MAKNIKCPYCKKIILDTTKFCPECGKKLTIAEDNKSSIPQKPVQKNKFNMTEVFNDDEPDDEEELLEEDEDMDDFDDEDDEDDNGFDNDDSDDDEDDEDLEDDDEYEDSEEYEDDSDDDDDYDEEDDSDDEDFEDDDEDDNEEDFDDDDKNEEYDDDEDELEGDEEYEEPEEDDEEDFDDEDEIEAPAPQKQVPARKNINTKSVKGTSAIMLSEAKSKHDARLPKNNNELNKARQERIAKENIARKKEAIKSQSSPAVRQQVNYDVNHDHYYDDVLPEMIDDISKFPFEVLIKAGGAIIFLVGAIAYCIYYVNI